MINGHLKVLFNDHLSHMNNEHGYFHDSYKLVHFVTLFLPLCGNIIKKFQIVSHVVHRRKVGLLRIRAGQPDLVTIKTRVEHVIRFRVRDLIQVTILVLHIIEGTYNDANITKIFFLMQKLFNF